MSFLLDKTLIPSSVVVTSLCDHTFCLDCISLAISSAPISPVSSEVSQSQTSLCPVDRRPLCLGDLVPASKIVANMVNELQAYCSHRSAGCFWKGQRQSIQPHLTNDCHYASLPCPLIGCQAVVLRSLIDQHVEQCPFRPFQCPSCGSYMLFCDIENHQPRCPFQQHTECPYCLATFPRSSLTAHTESCQMVVVSCKLGVFGCPWKGPRSQLESLHTQTCPYIALEGFLVMTDKNINRISEDCAILKQDSLHMATKLDLAALQLQSLQQSIGETLLAHRQPPLEQELPQSQNDHLQVRNLMDELGYDMHRIKIDMDAINIDMTSRISSQIAPIVNEAHHLRSELIKTQATCRSIQIELTRLSSERREFIKDPGNTTIHNNSGIGGMQLEVAQLEEVSWSLHLMNHTDHLHPIHVQAAYLTPKPNPTPAGTITIPTLSYNTTYSYDVLTTDMALRCV
ncbi:hypothetical protein BSLG_007108 [Batrachochytrium salamandrivorans]|nr:hypothetical protein BSLG_007108 [Batrachochytrium salamandrivorans]